jgi:adenylate cyclase
VVSDHEQVRRLAAVLVADAVGYSGRMQVAETATYRQYKDDLETVFLPRIAEHRGRVVKTTGDGVLAEFASIVDCLKGAMEIQLTLAGRPEGGLTERLAYRMGINLGDIIVEPDDIYGDGVNMAERLQGIAEPGGIALSADAHRLVVGKLDADFEDIGEHRLKNIAKPVRVFRVLIGGSKAGEVRAMSPQTTFAAVPSIAVLPFDSLNSDADQSYFSDGITTDILTELSKFSELFIIASHTVFTYKGRSVKIQDVGRELGVRYVVEGSVQRGGDRIRITVQLIEAATGRHLWAERYNRSASDFLSLEDEIVRTIVNTLVSRVDMSEHHRVMHREPHSLEAYDVYLRGRAAWREWTSQSNRLAQQCFNKAIELDPTFASAYGYLSYTMVQAWLGGWASDHSTLAEARRLGQKAVTLGPGNFENHWSLAMAYLYCREFDASMAAFTRSYDMNPNCAGLLIDMAEANVFMGRPDESIAQIEKAMRLDPVYPESYLWTIGVAYYHAGRYDDCLKAIGRIVRLPNLARRHQAAALVRLGRSSEAQQASQQFLSEDPGYTLARENLWPYKNTELREAFVADLRAAGLPD